IAVDFDGSPAHNDQQQLNQLEAKQQKQKQQAKQQQEQAVTQTTQQLIAEGVPPDEAQAEAEQQVKAQAPPGPSAKQQQKSAQQAYVGGQTAGYIDLAERISDRLARVIAVVIMLSFVLLMIAFRSLLVPLTAGLMNLLSVGAAYGVLTFVFQEGHGATLIGLE